MNWYCISKLYTPVVLSGKVFWKNRQAIFSPEKIVRSTQVFDLEFQNQMEGSQPPRLLRAATRSIFNGVRKIGVGLIVQANLVTFDETA